MKNDNTDGFCTVRGVIFTLIKSIHALYFFILKILWWLQLWSIAATLFSKYDFIFQIVQI